MIAQVNRQFVRAPRRDSHLRLDTADPLTTAVLNTLLLGHR